MFAASAAGERVAGLAVAALHGSLLYSASSGRSALARCAPPEPEEAPAARGGAPEAEATEASDGADRYLAYAAALARLKIVLLKAKGALALGAKAAAAKAAGAKAAAAESARYVAYSSDVGESMRPVLKPWMVNATYGVAVGYVLYDAGSDVRRKQLAGHPNDVLAATGCYKLVFHGLVSLALPAVLIHAAVHRAHDVFSAEAFAAFPRVVKFGPSAVGLGLIPLMPLFDPPAERVLEAAFDRAWPAWRVGEPEHHHHDKKD